MKNRYIIILLAIFIFTKSFAQQIDITVSNLNKDRASISSLSGEKVSLIDSVFLSYNGKFHFSLEGENTHTEFYPLAFLKWTHI